jgi:hypothetical protein
MDTAVPFSLRLEKGFLTQSKIGGKLYEVAGIAGVICRDATTPNRGWNLASPLRPIQKNYCDSRADYA